MLTNVYVHPELYNVKNHQHVVAIQQRTGGKFISNGFVCQLVIDRNASRPTK